VRQARSLGLERSHDLAAFLPVWDEEEAEHGRALHFLLSHQMYDPPRPAPATISLRRRTVARVPTGLLGRLPQTEFLFCVLGAAAEYLAIVTYTELVKRTHEPAVGALLRDIARQEARHFAFFLAVAKDRGAAISNLNGRVARRVLASIWEPIGVPSLGRPAWQHLFSGWMQDADFTARLGVMDRVVDSIPHLNGMHLMTDFLREVVVGPEVKACR
jgi:hypothetical protein